jgi:hypothetical protein
MAVISKFFATAVLLATAFSSSVPILKRAYSGVATFNNYAAQSKYILLHV